MSSDTSDRIQRLTDIATQLRRDVVNCVYFAKDGHPAPSMSIADLMAALYFDILRVDPSNPRWMGRDRFILSKGHAAPILYAALARRGYFPPAELKTLRALGSRLQGHPDMNLTPGVDATSGSLGHGLSQACGLALAARRRDSDSLTFVLTGDGELEEGIVWEAAMAIAKFKLTNLIAIVDNNGMQSGGTVQAVGGLYPLRAKWEAFGWHVVDLDGHDMGQIVTHLEWAALRGRSPSGNAATVPVTALQPAPASGQPIVYIAHTIKGRGVSFMEGDNSWHKRVPTDEEHRLAMAALKGLDLD
jgi:transketolase